MQDFVLSSKAWNSDKKAEDEDHFLGFSKEQEFHWRFDFGLCVLYCGIKYAQTLYMSWNFMGIAFKDSRPMNLAEEILSHTNIQHVAWIWLAAFSQIYTAEYQ